MKKKVDKTEKRKLKLSDIDKAIKDKLKQDGIKDKWIGKHLTIDVIGFED